MPRRHPPHSSASAPALPLRGCDRSAEARTLPLDAFVAEVYLPHVRLRKRSWKVDERIARQHLSPAFGDRRIVDLTREEVERWMRGLSAQELAPSTCNRVLAVLKSICSLAAMHGLLPAGSSPCLNVRPLANHTPHERYLTPDEARRLMRALENSRRPEAKALRLLLLTGARKSEILKARWEHVRPDQHLLTVPLSKSGRPRHIPLSDEAVNVIRSIRREQGSPWLFPGHAPGKPLADIYIFWSRLRSELGLADVRIHDLRHTFASFLVNAGHSLYEVQKLLGHSDPRTTMRYAHLGQDSLVAAAETVSNCLARMNRGDSGGTSVSAPLLQHEPGGNDHASQCAACEAGNAQNKEKRRKKRRIKRYVRPSPGKSGIIWLHIDRSLTVALSMKL